MYAAGMERIAAAMLTIANERSAVFVAAAGMHTLHRQAIHRRNHVRSRQDDEGICQHRRESGTESLPKQHQSYCCSERFDR